jgi:hypothetical protein
LERLDQTANLSILREALISGFSEEIYQFGILADTAELPAPYAGIIVGKKKRDLLMTRAQVVDLAGAYKYLLTC